MNDLTPSAGATAVALRSEIDTDAALDLLQFASSWDNRKPSMAMAEAWATSAELAEWTMVEARAAVQWLSTHERQYLTPAMVTAWIESRRRRARLSEEGTNPDGTRKVTFEAAVKVWRDAFRSVGPRPSIEQETKASELLEQMLDDAGDPVIVLSAAVFAGRRMSPRIDWQLEKLAADDQFYARMPVCPVEYVTDRQLDISFAVGQPDFPPEWKVYDPLPDDIDSRTREDFIRAWSGFRAADKVPDYKRPVRDLPDWLVEHMHDTRHRDRRDYTLMDTSIPADERATEAEAFLNCRRRAHGWIKTDWEAWRWERIPVVRAWYAAHPHLRRAFNKGPDLAAWWEN
jgi:hypothetical protein